MPFDDSNLNVSSVPTVNTLTQYVVYLSCMFGQVFVYSFGGQVILDEVRKLLEKTKFTIVLL